MKLELKHIAPYAVYGLTGLFFEQKDIVTSISFENKIISSLNTGNILLINFKPILRLLSDLTIKELSSYYTDVLDEELEIIIESVLMWPLNQSYTFTTEFLLKNHYDIYNLINNGLAININDLSIQSLKNYEKVYSYR